MDDNEEKLFSFNKPDARHLIGLIQSNGAEESSSGGGYRFRMMFGRTGEDGIGPELKRDCLLSRTNADWLGRY